MSEATERALGLVTELRNKLDVLEEGLRSGSHSDEDVLRIESMLVARRWGPHSMGLTGSWGYDPRAVYEKCSTCDHYRLK
jgi:hypothetical protein